MIQVGKCWEPRFSALHQSPRFPLNGVQAWIPFKEISGDRCSAQTWGSHHAAATSGAGVLSAASQPGTAAVLAASAAAPPGRQRRENELRSTALPAIFGRVLVRSSAEGGEGCTAGSASLGKAVRATSPREGLRAASSLPDCGLMHQRASAAASLTRTQGSLLNAASSNSL